MQLHCFDNTDELNQQFTQWLEAILGQAIKERGHAYLVVSGGKTPQNLFRRLAQAKLNWQQITITLTDERWIAPTENDSNEHLVKANLLQYDATKASFISLYTEKENANAGLTEIEARLSALPTFDAVILGMGEDGHTASLFPCSPEIVKGLADTQAAVIAVNPTTAPYQRVSLTKSRLLNSRAIFLHLVGQKKLTVLNEALAATDPLVMPICAFLNHPATDVQVMFAPQ